MSASSAGISRLRVLLGAVGALLALFGGLRLATEIPGSQLLVLAVWLVGALVVHDAVLSPLIVGLGVLLHRMPARLRRHVQAALVAGGIVTVVAIPLIYRAGSQPEVKAVLEQDYAVNLALLLVIIIGTAGLGYLVQVVRDRRSVLRRGHRQRSSWRRSD